MHVSKIYVGRQYGGVAFLCRKTTAINVSVIGADDNGRCLGLSVKLCERTFRIFSICFLRFTTHADCFVELGNCLAIIENNITEGYESILLGDANFECDLSNVGFRTCSSVLTKCCISCCDDLIIGSKEEKYTYFNESLGLSSMC